MFSSIFRSLVLAVALASPGTAVAAGTAVGRTSYDGSWSVLIVTESGACDRAYRYGVQISNGQVLPDEQGGVVNLQGRVAPNGVIQVSVSAGDNRANGSGRLSHDRGGGLWRGQASTGTCAGSWEAERRE